MCPVCCNSEDEDDHLEVVGIFSSILSLWLRRGPELQRAGVNVETAQFSVQRRGNQLVVLQTHNRHEDVYFKRTQRKLNSNFVVQIMFPMGKKYSAQLHIKSRPASLCRVKYNYRDIHLLEKHFNRYVYICIRRMIGQTGFQSCFCHLGDDGQTQSKSTAVSDLFSHVAFIMYWMVIERISGDDQQWIYLWGSMKLPLILTASELSINGSVSS